MIIFSEQQAKILNTKKDKNMKYEFLSKYIKDNSNSKIDAAWTSLSNFYKSLPARAKGHNRKIEYTYLIEKFQNAFDSILQIISECPFVKIEISNQRELEDMFNKILQINANQLTSIGTNQAYYNLIIDKLKEIQK